MSELVDDGKRDFLKQASLLTAHWLSVATCEQTWLVQVSTVQLTPSCAQSLLLRHS